MLQATILDCLFFDLFPFSDDVFVSSEVDIRWCDVAQTFLVTMVIVILDECLDLLFKVAGQIIVFQKDAVFHGLVPSLDFTLSLGMERRTAHMVHFVFFRIEVTAVIVGAFLGGVVGIGTLFFAFGIGPALALSILLLTKLFDHNSVD